VRKPRARNSVSRKPRRNDTSPARDRARPRTIAFRIPVDFHSNNQQVSIDACAITMLSFGVSRKTSTLTRTLPPACAIPRNPHILRHYNSSRINTSKNRAISGISLTELALKPPIINTSGNKDLKPPRINTSGHKDLKFNHFNTSKKGGRGAVDNSAHACRQAGPVVRLPPRTQPCISPDHVQ
jgi:hypothetical protein